MKSIIKYTLITASRDWLFLGLFLLIILSSSLSIFLGNTALAEQGMMSTAYIGGTTRIIAIVGLILFVCFHVRRSFENKEVELILSKPISRNQFVISYFSGFAVLSLFIILPIALIMFSLSVINLINLDYLGLLFWLLSFYLEALTMVALGFFASLILSSPVTSVLFCFAFYFMSRIFGFFLISVNNPASITKGSKVGSFMERILDILGIIIPRFDMFTKSEWLIYGIDSPKLVLLFLASVLLYIPLLLTMALFDFSRKQF
jgi:ABC-type transport system involved in multi-copper enzyme maturation permease subunit